MSSRQVQIFLSPLAVAVVLLALLLGSAHAGGPNIAALIKEKRELRAQIDGLIQNAALRDRQAATLEAAVDDPKRPDTMPSYYNGSWEHLVENLGGGYPAPSSRGAARTLAAALRAEASGYRERIGNIKAKISDLDIEIVAAASDK